MNEEVEFKKEIGEGVDYFRILKYRIAVVGMAIATIGFWVKQWIN